MSFSLASAVPARDGVVARDARTSSQAGVFRPVHGCQGRCDSPLVQYSSAPTPNATKERTDEGDARVEDQLKGRNALLSNKFQLGAEASVAAGPVGAGAQAAITDILAFSRTQGVFGGISVEGATIAVRDKWNAEYYGEGTRPVDILETRNKTNPGAEKLRVTMAKVGGR